MTSKKKRVTRCGCGKPAVYTVTVSVDCFCCDYDAANIDDDLIVDDKAFDLMDIPMCDDCSLDWTKPSKKDLRRICRRIRRYIYTVRNEPEREEATSQS